MDISSHGLSFELTEMDMGMPRMSNADEIDYSTNIRVSADMYHDFAWAHGRTDNHLRAHKMLESSTAFKYLRDASIDGAVVDRRCASCIDADTRCIADVGFKTCARCVVKRKPGLECDLWKRWVFSVMRQHQD